MLLPLRLRLLSGFLFVQLPLLFQEHHLLEDLLLSVILKLLEHLQPLCGMAHFSLLLLCGVYLVEGSRHRARTSLHHVVLATYPDLDRVIDLLLLCWLLGDRWLASEVAWWTLWRQAHAHDLVIRRSMVPHRLWGSWILVLLVGRGLRPLNLWIRLHRRVKLGLAVLLKLCMRCM